MNAQNPIPYLICATPRSGSTLLCESLRNTRLAGNPDEYFGPMHVARWNAKWGGLTEEGYFQRVLEQGRGANGVWGAKVMRLYWHDFTSLLRKISQTPDLSDAKLLETLFPGLKYIFIIRRNKVRQAVSWLKFVQGSAWFWTETDTGILDYLEIDKPSSLTFAERRLKKQYDVLSDEWVQRYLELNRHREQFNAV